MNQLADRAGKRGIERHAYPAQFEVRARPDGTGGTKYQLDGYATVYDAPFTMWDVLGEYDEVVRQGSGAKTLSENPDVMFVYDHQGMPLARTKNGSLRLSEDTTGLHSNAPDLNGSRDIVREVVAAVEEGLLDEMSFAFRVTRQEWSPDYAQRDILEYSLHRGDVSVVNFGANPATNIALRSQDFDRMSDDQARAMLARLEQRLQVVVIDTGEDEDDTAACPECGAMNDTDAAFCDQCGASMAPAAAPMAMSLSLARALADRDDSLIRHLELTRTTA